MEVGSNGSVPCALRGWRVGNEGVVVVWDAVATGERPLWRGNGGKLVEEYAAEEEGRRGLTRRLAEWGSMPRALGEHGFT